MLPETFAADSCFLDVSQFCHTRNILLLETMFPVWQNWETSRKHVSSVANFSGNRFPRFASAQPSFWGVFWVEFLVAQLVIKFLDSYVKIALFAAGNRFESFTRLFSEILLKGLDELIAEDWTKLKLSSENWQIIISQFRCEICKTSLIAINELKFKGSFTQAIFVAKLSASFVARRSVVSSSKQVWNSGDIAETK